MYTPTFMFPLVAIFGVMFFLWGLTMDITTFGLRRKDSVKLMGIGLCLVVVVPLIVRYVL